MNAARHANSGPLHESKVAFLNADDDVDSTVVNPVLRSWRRSRHHGLQVNDKVIFNPISRGLQRELEEKNQSLLAHSRPQLLNLIATLRRSEWAVSVLDRYGNVIHALRPDSPVFSGLGLAFRTGINLGESSAGTTGPACCIAEQEPIIVSGDEHYLAEAAEFQCYSAPIFGGNNELIGVVNASRRYLPRHVNGVLMATLQAAQQIENRVIEAHPDCVFLKISDGSTGDLGSLGLVALDRDGRIVGANRYAVNLLGLPTAVSLGAQFFCDYFQDDFGMVVDGLFGAGASRLKLESHCGQFLLAEAHRPAEQKLSSRAIVSGVHKPCLGLPSEFQNNADRVGRAFERHIPILLKGETGTGKEHFARWLHTSYVGDTSPWVALNCAALPPTLIESELFGYVPGAFTGASPKGQIGKILQADGGTLFLDEIGDMPIATQTQLLRVLQERKLIPVGGTKEIPVHFRLISATHHDLRQKITVGEFREDLYYRICGLSFTLPKLAARSDFHKLVQTILAAIAPDAMPIRLTPDAMLALKQHPWPGNIRQLESVLRVAALTAPDGTIDLEHLPEEFVGDGKTGSPDGVSLGDLAAAEAEIIRDTLQAFHGNVSAAATRLSITRATLYNKMAAYGIRNRFRP